MGRARTGQILSAYRTTELREYLLIKKEDIRALEVKERLKEVVENKAS